MIRQTHRPISGRQFYLATAMTAFFAWSGPAHALPVLGTGGGSNGASPTFVTNGSSLTVTQTSSRAVIDWNSFNIGSTEQVTFNQTTGKSAIAFNVVPAGVSTTINGKLSANGGLWLFSPAGILFGAGSTVSAGSFLASTGVFNSNSQAEALNGATNQIDIFPQGTPGQGSIDVQPATTEGCTTLPAAIIDADAGFVLLHSPTIMQDGSVTASDAVVYNADENVSVQISPSSTGIALVNEYSTAGTPSASKLESSGSTTAGTWFEADAANDEPAPGFGVINLGGLVIANGMKADTANPSDPNNGFSVILDADSAGATSGPQVTTINGANGSIVAASGVTANAGTIDTGSWTSSGGGLQLKAANAITIPDGDQLSTAGAIDIDPNGPVTVNGAVNSATSVFIAATGVTLGPDGSISAGSSSTEGGGTISTTSGTATVTLQNYATNGDTPVAPGPGGGNILIGAPLTWASGGAPLTLSAYNALIVGAPITASDDAAQVVINTGQGGTGDYSFVNGGSLSFTGTQDSNQGLSINNTTYTLIFNQADLLGINSGPTDGNGNLNGDYALAGPLDFNTGNTATVFTGAPIAPTVYSTFNGTFLGLGNTISNLNIQEVTPIGQSTPNGNGGTNGAIGLFGFVGSGGLVRDINLSNATISGGDGIQAGALVGNLDGIVMNASSSGRVTVGDNGSTSTGQDNNDSANAYAGGLVGFSDGQIINAHSSATVMAGGATAGGLVGEIINDGSVVNSGSIANSSASGSVTVGANTVSLPIAGGLVGEAFSAGAITGSFATGMVTGGDGSIVGGFAGELEFSPLVSGSFATGAVNGGAGSQAGGFAGLVYGSSIDTSYATGAVTQTTGGAGGTSNYAGGFAGLLQDASSITRSYSSGAVQAAGGADASSYTYAGGFVGDVDTGSTISNAYSLGAVTLTGTPITAPPQAPATFGDFGGFAGIVQQSGAIDHVYATGLASSTGLNTGMGAGLVAVLGNPNDIDKTGSLSDSYWDQATTGQSVGYHITPTVPPGGPSGTATAVSPIGGSGPNPYATATYTANFGTDLTTGAGTWVMIPGETRPILSSEYSTTITNAHQLQLMELHLAADYTLANNIDASETTSAAGIWNPANGFVPVGGNGEANFTGVFNGQGYTISNLTIKFTTADPQNPIPSLTTDGVVGLFGFVGPTGVLENVNLANAQITAGDGMLAGALAGGSVGLVNFASSSGAVTVGNEINTGGGITAEAGGLVGGSGGTIANSQSSATVTGGNAFAGGLLGSEGNGGLVTDSSASGAVSVTSYPAGFPDSPDAGGLIGEVDNATVVGSFATGDVGGGAGAHVGGLIGSIDDGVVTTSYATGNVLQTAGGVANSNAAAGGFAGAIDGGSQVTQSYASGDVSSFGAVSGAFTRAGGFAGQVEDPGTSVSESYALGAVNVTAGPGVNTSGGFAGAVDNSGSVDHVYATGLVSGGSGVTLGGLVAQVGAVNGGVQQGGSVSDSYWDEGTTGQITGVNLAGTGTQANNTGIGGSTGLSPYLASTYSSFASADENFDFTSIWFMVPGATRPILRSEYSTDITNAHQLQLMDLNLGANYTLGNDIDATNTDGASGIWNPATGFSPIGATANSPFKGTFDGQGYTISNLTIIDTTTVHQNGSSGNPSDGAAGLFGFVGSNGVLENVNLANANVSGGEGMEVGALAGDVAGAVTNASSSGTVGVGAVDGEFDAAARAGGLVGDLTGTIQNSSSSATVTGGSGALVGGLIGEAEGGTVTGSFATGAVNGGADSIAGGFIGVSSGIITTSYATGGVSQAAAVVDGDIAGGFAGEISGGQVSQSFSTGAVNVAGSETLQDFAGGFVGEVQGNGEVTDAYSTSPVTVTGSAQNYVGGFAGFITDTGSVTNALAVGTVSASGYVGGLVGFLDENATITNGYWDEDATATNQTNGIGSQDGTVVNIVGMVASTPGKFSITDPFTPATYFVASGPGVVPGFDFATTWSIPSSVDGINSYPQLYGASHVINITAQPATSVYGNYPVYELTVTGLQGGDTIASAVQGYQVQALDAPTSSTSGYYNVNDIPADQLNSPYDLSVSNIAATGAGPGVTGVYRAIYNDNVNNVDGGLSVTQAQLTLYSGGDDKTYDASTDDENPQLGYSGLVPGDNASISAHFAQSDVGDEIPIIIDGYSVTDGNEGNNYAVTTVNGTGEIDQAPLTVSLTETDKVYDTTNMASGITSDQYTLNGGFGDVELSETLPTTGTYGGVNVGSYTVTVTGVNLTGSGLSNYSFNGEATGPGSITPAPLTLTAQSDTKPYDGTTADGLTPLVGQTPGVDGLYAGDTITNLTQSFDSKDVNAADVTDGRTLSVDPTYVISDGNGGNNYTVTTVTALGTITPAPLVLTATFNEKTYDGGVTAAATPTVGQTPGTNGLYSGDSISGLTESYDLKDANGVDGRTLSVDPTYTIDDGNGGADYTVTTVTTLGTIDPLALTATLTGTVEKTYDTTTDANLATNNYSLSSPISGDDVSLVAPTGPASGTYDNPNAGTGKTVTVTGLQLSGDDAEDYSVNSIASGAVGIIDQAPLTLTAVTDSRAYNGGILSSGQPTVGQTPGVDGLYSGDTITNLTQSFDSKDVNAANVTDGRTLSVDPTYIISDGNGGGNYIVKTVTALGTITPAPLVLTATFNEKTYDGGITAAATPTVGSTPGVNGLYSGDSISNLTESYDLKDANGVDGRTLSVDPTYTIDDGNGGADYSVTTFTTLGTIDPKPLTASLVGTVQKTYDGDTTATLSGPVPGVTTGNYSLSGVVSGDDVSLNDPTSGTYNNRNAGTGKIVTVTGLQLSGEDEADYTVNGTAMGAVGVIIPAPLTLTAVTDTKTYDGGVTSNGAPTHSALIEGDSISDEVQSFGSKNVEGAGGSTLLVTGYTIDDGNGGANYAVTLVSARGTINPAPLTIAAVADTKTYDGTTASSATPTVATLLGGDTITGLTETYDSKDAGTRTLSVAGYTINDGNDGGNYIVTTTTAAGEIDPKALTAVLIGNVQKAYDGNTAATLTASNYSLPGVIGTDDVSLNDPTSGTYDNPSAGTHKIVTVGGLAISGADAANYTVNGSAAGPVGTITAPPQTLQITVPTQDVTTPGFLQTATDAAGAVQNAITNTTTVVNVFPVGNDDNNAAQGDNLPITGAGNRDLWGSSEDNDQACPPSAPTPCPPNGGSQP